LGNYLHLSIHDIHSDHRVGPALWSSDNRVNGPYDLELIKSTENALGITFRMRFDDHWKLFDLSTTETDTSDNFPLIESGRIDFDPKLKSGRKDFDPKLKSGRKDSDPNLKSEYSLGLSEIFIQLC
jgi:hypothetical protein